MKISFRQSTLVICASLALAACAPMASHPFGARDYWVDPAQPRPSSHAASLLLYADYLRHLSADEQARETDHARELAGGEQSGFRTLQYALALSLPGGDLKKAQQLSDSAMADSDTELAALATFLSSEVGERRRLETESKRADTEAKRADSEARRADNEAKRADTEAKRADAEMKRADELEKKLEAVKTIERNLIERKRPHLPRTDEGKTQAAPGR